jgi:tight adherence protein B
LVVVIDVTPTALATKRAAAIAQDISTLRPAGQQVGLVEADSFPPVVLGMTSNGASIQSAFAMTPTIARHGEHLWNAALTGVNLLASSKINAGSVIVLSDGADRGDPSTLNQLVATALAAHVRIFTLGIASPHFSASILKEMASRTGGHFYEASPSQLRPVFDAIESQLTNEYLIDYRSLQAPGRTVPASLHIDGVSGTYDISYVAPALTTVKVGHRSSNASFWGSTSALIVVGALSSVLLLLGVLALVSRDQQRTTVRSRLKEFLPSEQHETPGIELTADVNPVFARTQGLLERARWWPRFREEVDIAQIQKSPIEIVFLTLAAALFAAMILVVGTGSMLAGILTLLASPFVMRFVVRQLMRRQQRRFSLQLGEHLQEVASAMRAGRSLVDALVLITAEASEPTKREFERALADERLGVPLDEALTQIVRRMDNEDMSQVALVAALDRTTGASTSEVLDRVADGIRENTEIRRELRTLTAQARLARWILTALPAFMLALFSLSDPAYERPMYHTTFGVVLLIFSAVSVAAGSLVMSRLVKIEL